MSNSTNELVTECFRPAADLEFTCVSSSNQRIKNKKMNNKKLKKRNILLVIDFKGYDHHGRYALHMLIVSLGVRL